MPVFVRGLELNRRYYAEVVQPLLGARLPNLVYSAGLLGYGSDVLGYDSEISTDHEWGPRLLVFLRDEDFAILRPVVSEVLRRDLPPTFLGYSTNFSTPDTEGGVRLIAPGTPGQIEHHIALATLNTFMRTELGINARDAISARDWLTFPEQKLLEVTAGTIYHDGLQQLASLRQQFAYYPHDVWLYRLAAQWQRISQEEAFVGRSGDVGDELGSRVIAARLVRDLMHLCFLLERRYAPYSKWLGTAFARLKCADDTMPLCMAVLAAQTWHEREERLATIYSFVAMMQNALAITEPLDASPRPYHDRPYRVIGAERFATSLAGAIQDEHLRQIISTVGLVGAVDQFADSTDVLSFADRSRSLGRFLDG